MSINFLRKQNSLSKNNLSFTVSCSSVIISQLQKVSHIQFKISSIAHHMRTNQNVELLWAPQLNVCFQLVNLDFPQLMRICCINLYTVMKNSRRLKYLWNKRDFKIDTSQTVCLLIDLFIINSSPKNFVPAFFCGVLISFPSIDPLVRSNWLSD